MRIVRGMEAAKSLLTERFTVDLDGDERGETVRQILRDVREGGDRALLDYSKSIDGVELTRLDVPPEEIAASRDGVSGEILDALELAAGRIRRFHETQKRKLGLEFVEDGLGFLVRPLERVGIYVPGGKASYPSTVLMTAIPAKVAGVDEIIMATPPGSDGSVPATTLAAAGIAGVDRVFKLGGAQAVAAIAYGTESVPRVDKVCGPGNIFVTLAKRQVFGTVAVDGLYGPTETVILADDSANPVFCAADLIAQAEHDEMARAVLVTASSRLAEDVNRELERQVNEPGNVKTLVDVHSSIAIVIVADLDEAFELVNLYAPEHLCLMLSDASSCLERIRHAGGIFIGAPEALGDYTAGPSHVMPTGGTARFSSPLSVLDFLKLSVLVELDDSALKALGPASAAIARAEGLYGHALSVERRLREM